MMHNSSASQCKSFSEFIARDASVCFCCFQQFYKNTKATFVFVSMNISFVFGLLNLAITETLWVDLCVRIVIGIVAMVKIGSAAAIVGRIGEKWYHTLIIGVLIIVAPYAWDLAGPSITPMLPSWAQ